MTHQKPGKILYIVDSRVIVVDLGSNDGMKTGVLLNIVGETPPIYNPDNNEIIIGGLTVIKSQMIIQIVRDNYSLCSILENEKISVTSINSKWGTKSRTYEHHPVDVTLPRGDEFWTIRAGDAVHAAQKSQRTKTILSITPPGQITDAKIGAEDIQNLKNTPENVLTFEIKEWYNKNAANLENKFYTENKTQISSFMDEYHNIINKRAALMHEASDDFSAQLMGATYWWHFQFGGHFIKNQESRRKYAIDMATIDFSWHIKLSGSGVRSTTNLFSNSSKNVTTTINKKPTED